MSTTMNPQVEIFPPLLAAGPHRSVRLRLQNVPDGTAYELLGSDPTRQPIAQFCTSAEGFSLDCSVPGVHQYILKPVGQTVPEVCVTVRVLTHPEQEWLILRQHQVSATLPAAQLAAWEDDFLRHHPRDEHRWSASTVHEFINGYVTHLGQEDPPPWVRTQLKQDAQDVFQNSILALLDYRDKFDPDSGDVDGLFHTILRSKVNDGHRSHREPEGQDALDEQPSRIGGPYNSGLTPSQLRALFTAALAGDGEWLNDETRNYLVTLYGQHELPSDPTDDQVQHIFQNLQALCETERLRYQTTQEEVQAYFARLPNALNQAIVSALQQCLPEEPLGVLLLGWQEFPDPVVRAPLAGLIERLVLLQRAQDGNSNKRIARQQNPQDLLGAILTGFEELRRLSGNDVRFVSALELVRDKYPGLRLQRLIHTATETLAQEASRDPALTSELHQVRQLIANKPSFKQVADPSVEGFHDRARQIETELARLQQAQQPMNHTHWTLLLAALRVIPDPRIQKEKDAAKWHNTLAKLEACASTAS